MGVNVLYNDKVAFMEGAAERVVKRQQAVTISSIRDAHATALHDSNG